MQPARPLDEGEILVGQRQDGDLRQIDLLLPRQHQQKVERPLKSLDVDDQGRLAAVLDWGRILKIQFFCRHAVATGGVIRATGAIIAEKRARASVRSNSAGGRRAAKAAAARCAGLPASMGASAATALISSRWPLQCRIRSHPAANAARLRAAMLPDRAPIDRSSLIRAPSKPIQPRITSPITVADVGAGSTGSIAV